MELVRRLLTNRDLRRRIAGHRDLLYRVALSWCGEPGVADDLVQETLMIALQRSAQLRDPERLKAWMLVILRNCWNKHLGRRRPSVDIEDTVVASENNVEAACQTQQTVASVRKAILRLPEAQRQTLTLVDLAGLSYAEVADALEIPIGTVMSRLYAARQSLQKTLSAVYAAEPDKITYLRRVR
jgi:RNA polymerase sigma-70 factor (ECF subfamily)